MGGVPFHEGANLSIGVLVISHSPFSRAILFFLHRSPYERNPVSRRAMEVSVQLHGAHWADTNAGEGLKPGWSLMLTPLDLARFEKQGVVPQLTKGQGNNPSFRPFSTCSLTLQCRCFSLKPVQASCFF